MINSNITQSQIIILALKYSHFCLIKANKDKNEEEEISKNYNALNIGAIFFLPTFITHSAIT